MTRRPAGRAPCSTPCTVCKFRTWAARARCIFVGEAVFWGRPLICSPCRPCFSRSAGIVLLSPLRNTNRLRQQRDGGSESGGLEDEFGAVYHTVCGSYRHRPTGGRVKAGGWPPSAICPRAASALRAAEFSFHFCLIGCWSLPAGPGVRPGRGVTGCCGADLEIALARTMRLVI